MKILFDKLKEIVISVAPVIGIVLVVQLILFVAPNGTPVDTGDLVRFLIGSVILIIGLTILLFGLDLSINKVGSDAGNILIKTRKLGLILTVAALLGFFIAVAEPDLLILAMQISHFSNGLLNTYLIIMSIAFAVGIMLLLSFLRQVFKWQIRPMLLILYGVIFATTILLQILNPDMFSIAFDSSASVTGAVAVPFILALGIGLSRSDKHAREEDSFGMVGLTSGGTIVGASVYLLIRSSVDLPVVEITKNSYDGIINPFIQAIPTYLWESALALVPFIVLYLILQFTMIKEDRKRFLSKLKGFLYVFIGLMLFLLSVNVGYIGIARELGHNLAELGLAPVAIVAFIIGALVILAESSVHVLTDQIYNVTSGSLQKGPVLVALSLGVGSALMLMVFRTYFEWLSLAYLILPLYAIALILSFFTPKLFVGLAFDSGATSSGPMAATFILAFIQGVAIYYGGNSANIGDVFGTLAMVTVVPIIAIEILGIIYGRRLRREQIYD